MRIVDLLKNLWKNGIESGIEDNFTKRDFMIMIAFMAVLMFFFGSMNFLMDKASCAYKGYVYEKDTKRPIFSECLIKIKDGSYIPLDKYMNKVLTFNDVDNME